MKARSLTLLLRTILGVAVFIFFAYSFYRRGIDGTFDFMMREEHVLPAISGVMIYVWLQFGPKSRNEP